MSTPIEQASAYILFEVLKGAGGDVGVITLNRPKALNALNLVMINGLLQQLHQWQTSLSIKAVIIKGNGGKAFCAGGDIRQLYEERHNTAIDLSEFFRREYQLNYLIHAYPKPFIAFLDGITMGGGVGISFHGSHPIATEKTIFAMPESNIGFFPDIGSSHFLSRCAEQMGIYIGLTGAQLNANDLLYAGLVRYVFSSERLRELLEMIVETAFSPSHPEPLNKILEEFQISVSKTSSLETYHALINQCFAGETIEQIMHSLQKNANPWCHQLLKTLQSCSPTSLKVILQQLRKAENLTLTECLQIDFRLVKHFLAGNDLFEGIRARLIDKDNKPQWQPAHLAGVSEQMINSYFAPLSLDEELTLAP